MGKQCTIWPWKKPTALLPDIGVSSSDTKLSAHETTLPGGEWLDFVPLNGKLDDTHGAGLQQAKHYCKRFLRGGADCWGSHIPPVGSLRQFVRNWWSHLASSPHNRTQRTVAQLTKLQRIPQCEGCRTCSDKWHVAPAWYVS